MTLLENGDSKLFFLFNYLIENLTVNVFKLLAIRLKARIPFQQFFLIK